MAMNLIGKVEKILKLFDISILFSYIYNKINIMKTLFLVIGLLFSLNVFSQTVSPYIDEFTSVDGVDEWSLVTGQGNTGIHNEALCFNVSGTYLDDNYYSFESPTLDLTTWSEVNVEFTIASNVRNGDLFAFWYYDDATLSWSGYNISGLFGTYSVTIPITTSKISFDLDTYANGGLNGKYAHVDRIVLSDPFVVLPVELVSLTVENHEDENYVSWITASELNCDYYNVERSVDGKMWNFVRMINGSGTTNSMTEYEIVDRYFEPTINYYKLTQYDFNGDSEEFDIISIDNTILEKHLIKLVNQLGQEISADTKGLVFEIYDDGTIVKKYK